VTAFYWSVKTRLLLWTALLEYWLRQIQTSSERPIEKYIDGITFWNLSKPWSNTSLKRWSVKNLKYTPRFTLLCQRKSFKWNVLYFTIRGFRWDKRRTQPIKTIHKYWFVSKSCWNIWFSPNLREFIPFTSLDKKNVILIIDNKPQSVFDPLKISTNSMYWAVRFLKIAHV
jgi:hypothetical protein